MVWVHERPAGSCNLGEGDGMPALLVMLAVGGSVVLLVLTAAWRSVDVSMAYAHAAVAAAMALALAATAIQECRRLLNAGSPASKIASSNAWYMGLVWSWGALALFVTYATGVLTWKEWWQFFLAFVLAAGLSVSFALALKRDAAAGREDAAMLRMARYVAIVQLAGMALTMLGLVIDGKMVRYANPRYADWAANNVFFFGALAIALISAYALRYNKHP